ncbi:hypothetical protein H0H93_004420, partial [Arthromyces matolae]
QRYSLVVNANQKVGNYRIRALPSAGQGNLPLNYNGGINSAILRYNGAPSVDPITSQKIHPKLLVESELHPLDNPAAPGAPKHGGADVSINLDIGIDLTTFQYSMN